MLVKESIIYLKCGVSTLEHVNLLWCLFASSPVKHLLQKTNTKPTSKKTDIVQTRNLNLGQRLHL